MKGDKDHYVRLFPNLISISFMITQSCSTEKLFLNRNDGISPFKIRMFHIIEQADLTLRKSVVLLRNIHNLLP